MIAYWLNEAAHWLDEGQRDFAVDCIDRAAYWVWLAEPADWDRAPDATTLEVRRAVAPAEKMVEVVR